MAKTRRLALKPAIPLINKKALYSINWNTKNLKGDYKTKIISKLDKIYDNLSQYIESTGLKGIVYYDEFEVEKIEDSIFFKNHDIKWDLPRIKGRCIADSVEVNGKLALQIVTLGNKIVEIYEKLEEDDLYSLSYYFHGFTVWLTEALADYHHDILHKESGITKPRERYSFGYPLCPDLTMQKDLFKLLQIDNSHEVALTPTFMMTPEQSTSAIVIL